MKKEIDEIYSKCNEVSLALRRKVPQSIVGFYPPETYDYGGAFDRFSELLSQIKIFSDNQWTVKGVTKGPTEMELAEALLDCKNTEKVDKGFRRFRCHLYQLGMFAMKLKEQIVREDSEHYITLYRDFMSDAQRVLSMYEYLKAILDYKGAVARYKAGQGLMPDKPKFRGCNMGKRPTMTKFDLRDSVNALFWLDMAPSKKDIPFRNLRPMTSLAMRQAVEMVGKSAIGFDSIVDNNGNPLKQFTQISWKFIAEFKEKTPNDSRIVRGTGDSWKISFPLPIRCIELVNRWCNKYTHNPNNPLLYILWYVLECYWSLTRPARNGISFNLEHGDIRIEGYNCMKREFEEFIAKENSRANVCWPDNGVHNGAWIINYGEAPSSSLITKMRIRQSLKNLSAMRKAFCSEIGNIFSLIFGFKKKY